MARQPRATTEEYTLGLVPSLDTEARALLAAAKVAAVGQAARVEFVDRDTAISVMELGVICGEHICVLGPPGVGKSAMTRFFAGNLGMGFFRKLLNPDTTRDELVGPIDPHAFGRGVWDRCWSGMATNEFVFLDEVGKASSQVINMTLDAMEERLVTSGTGDRKIPLHTLVGASNETLGDDLAAAWDRFTLRMVVSRLSEGSQVARLLTRKRGKRRSADETIPRTRLHELTPEDLRDMREQCLYMAESISDEVVELVVKLWSRLANVTSEPVTERRWERLPIVAAARALLMGRIAVEPDDLIVSQHILWTDYHEIEKIAEFVRNTVDSEAAEIAVKTRLVEELEGLRAQSVDPSNISEIIDRKARISFRASKLLREIPTTKTNRRAEWANLRERLSQLTEWAMADA